MRLLILRWVHIPVCILLFTMVPALVGCAGDGLFSTVDVDDAGVPAFSDSADGKLRHPHLMNRASKFVRRAKDGGGEGVGLIVALEPQKVLEREKVIERMKTLERYKVIERLQFNEAMNGFAVTVVDESGADDYGEFIQLLQEDSDIYWFEPDITVAVSPAAENARITSGTQMLPWGVERIGAYKRGLDDVDKVTLFVIDTGVESEDLESEDQIDFTPGTGGMLDADGHGTHVAAIAGSKDDGDGIVGVAPKVNIRSLRVLTGSEVDLSAELDLSTAIAAVEEVIKYKMSNPAMPVVANMSLGADIGTTAYNALDEAIQVAVSQGVIFVVSAGNKSADAATYTPAHVAEAITVGAYDQNDQFAWFSNYGSMIDILAPGDEVLSARPGDDELQVMSGTSMAAAHVSGAATLYLSQNPTATPEQVREALVSSGRSTILGSPKSTTNKTVYVGMDGELFSGSLAPFLRYAIAADGNIDFDATVEIAREDDAPENSSVFANGSLNVKTLTSSVDGFGFHHGGVDEEEALVTFRPRYNPLSLAVEQEVDTKMLIPEFKAENFQSLADRYDGDDVLLAGHYNMGTQEEPVIWYVDGKVTTSGTVTFSGYGVIVASDNIEFEHAVRNIDSDGVLGLYTSKDIKIGELAPVSLAGQIYSAKFESKSDFVLYGSITAFGDVKFTNDITVDLKHRPAEKVLTEPFWPSN